jgi:hypothetical protein
MLLKSFSFYSVSNDQPTVRHLALKKLSAMLVHQMLLAVFYVISWPTSLYLFLGNVFLLGQLMRDKERGFSAVTVTTKGTLLIVIVHRWRFLRLFYTLAPFGLEELKFNSHHINVPSNAWSTKCRLIVCMSAHIRSNLRDESIKPN